MASFRPLHDRVLVKRVKEEEKTKGGIIIPDTAQEKPQEGEVIGVGPGARDEDGERIPLDVKVGDRIRAGQQIGLSGQTGRATGPHLHWGFNWFETRLDPELLPKPAAASAASKPSTLSGGSTPGTITKPSRSRESRWQAARISDRRPGAARGCSRWRRRGRPTGSRAAGCRGCGRA